MTNRAQQADVEVIEVSSSCNRMELSGAEIVAHAINHTFDVYAATNSTAHLDAHRLMSGLGHWYCKGQTETGAAMMSWKLSA